MTAIRASSMLVGATMAKAVFDRRGGHSEVRLSASRLTALLAAAHHRGIEDARAKIAPFQEDEPEEAP